MDMNIVALCLLALVASTANAQVFDVTKYGAKPNVDITMALSNAWKAACASPMPSKVVVPRGTYGLGKVELRGPCKSPIEFQVQGTLKAPADPRYVNGDSWITLERINHLTVSGGGTFDGQGRIAWGKNDCNKNKNCAKLAINLRLNFLTNSIIRDVTSLDSKNFHVNVLGCDHLTFQHFFITAPGNSVNTDGIHIGRSTNINITDTHIATGDDCISLGDGSRQVTVTKSTCGPGHGISIGSLGKYPNEEPVVGITVRNCTIKGTMNGVRVKTWPASYVGTVSDLHFEDIIMDRVSNPVIIDQVYCPWNQCTASIPSKVKISNVSFKRIRGTSATPVAVSLICSRGVPCQNVELSDINLTYNGVGGPAKSQCSNVRPTITGRQNPPACSSRAQTA